MSSPSLPWTDALRNKENICQLLETYLCCVIRVPRAIWQRSDKEMKTDYYCGLRESWQPNEYRVKCSSFIPITLFLLTIVPIPLMLWSDKLRQEPYNMNRGLSIFITYLCVIGTVLIINVLIYYVSCPESGACFRRLEDNNLAMQLCLFFTILIYPLCILVGYALGQWWAIETPESNATAILQWFALGCVIPGGVIIFTACASILCFKCEQARKKALQIGDGVQTIPTATTVAVVAV